MAWSLFGRPLRSGRRVVAGFSGEEAVVRSKKEKNMRFGWMYEPAPTARGFHPEIRIDVEADDDDVAGNMALWDRILDSVQVLEK